MQFFIRLIFLSSLFFNSIPSFGNEYDLKKIKEDISGNDKEKKIKSLQALSNYYFTILGEEIKADSIANVAVIEAQLFNDKKLILSSLLNYCKVCQFQENNKYQSYFEDIFTLTKNGENNSDYFEAKLLQANIYIQLNDKRAVETILEATPYIQNNSSNQLKYNLMLAKIQANENNKTSAFKNYLEALYLAQYLENDTLILDCLNQISVFYSDNHNFEKAIEYNEKAEKICTDIFKNDAYKIFKQKLNKAEIYCSANKIDVAIPLSLDVIRIAKKQNYNADKNYIFSLLRTLLINNNKIDELYRIYKIEFPDELPLLNKISVSLLHRLQAVIYEKENKITAAIEELKLAEKHIENSNNIASKSNFYHRFGEFYLRQQNTSEAILLFKKALDNALKSQYIPYVITNSFILDSLISAQGNISEAYSYLKINKQYEDKKNESLQNDKLLALEIENIEKQNELQKEKLIYKTKQKTNLQLFIIVIIIILSMLILIFLSTRKVSKWVVKSFGFLTFIFFFEFIIYIADTYIHHVTHGMPLKIMMFKVVLIAILLPLHHWTEEKVVHYLLSKHLLKSNSFNPVQKIKEWIKNYTKENSTTDV